jgi:pyruvate,water dikinase
VAYLAAARQNALALGRRYVHADGLAAADDIFHLNAAELFALADARLTPAAAGRRAALRRAQLESWAAAPDQDVIAEDAAGAATDMPPPAPADAGAAGSWRGTPAAGGHARAGAFVARSPSEGLAMPAGGILVAASTDPAWTPLFLRAGALVMEAGGYLSHGAIVAREFGIPAIVNVQGIMRQVATGDVLEVDASRGTVRRLAAASSLGASDS